MTPETTQTARRVSPEDICLGDYVTILRTAYELPSFLWCSEVATHAPEKPVRYECAPCDSGLPMKVESVCLPYVFVATPHGRDRTIDVRRNELARLSREHGDRVWKAMKRSVRKRAKRLGK